jgi:hypothetical protein
MQRFRKRRRAAECGELSETGLQRSARHVLLPHPAGGRSDA